MPRVKLPASSAPKTATPTALPSWRAELSTPAASPARAALTASIRAVVSGGMARPAPTPTGTSSSSTTSTDVSASTSRSAAIPAANSSWPQISGRRGPRAAVSRPESRFTPVTRPVSGRNISPATAGEWSSTRWKNSPSTNTRP
jgi:hypothetical protein